MTGRPAETLTAAAGLAYVIAYFLGAVDAGGLTVALTAVIAALPATVTFLVELLRPRRASVGAPPPAPPAGPPVQEVPRP